MKNMTDLETTGSRWRRWAASLLPRLSGPIFDKEMRVSSRRRRNYVLRFLYIGFFTFLVAVAWLENVVHRTSSVYQASRMAAAGQSIEIKPRGRGFVFQVAIALAKKLCLLAPGGNPSGVIGMC